MESLKLLKLPQPPVGNANSERSDQSVVSISPEPEVEECCEDIKIKDIIEELGMDYSLVSNLKYVSHDPESDACTHCKLLEKVEDLQKGILKLNYDIGTSQEILKIKKNKNNDLKELIERLDKGIGLNTIPTDLTIDKSTKTCSCNNNCIVV
jgi:hypothetical protein